MKPIINDFSNEVKFQVGQKVEIDFIDVPIDERDVTTGFIYTVEARFPLTPSMRKIKYHVRLDGDGNYVKKECQLFEGVGPKIIVPGERLKLIQ